jgi:hypothetical protein
MFILACVLSGMVAGFIAGCKGYNLGWVTLVCAIPVIGIIVALNLPSKRS